MRRNEEAHARVLRGVGYIGVIHSPCLLGETVISNLVLNIGTHVLYAISESTLRGSDALPHITVNPFEGTTTNTTNMFFCALEKIYILRFILPRPSSSKLFRSHRVLHGDVPDHRSLCVHRGVYDGGAKDALDL